MFEIKFTHTFDTLQSILISLISEINDIPFKDTIINILKTYKDNLEDITLHLSQAIE